MFDPSDFALYHTLGDPCICAKEIELGGTHVNITLLLDSRAARLKALFVFNSRVIAHGRS